MHTRHRIEQCLYLAVILGLILPLISYCEDSPASSPEPKHRPKTGSILLTFAPSINGRKNEAELWALMLKLTAKKTTELGGES
jgi:hypothetical protein